MKIEVLKLNPVTLLKKRLWPSCCPVNFWKFSRAPFLQISFKRMLLNIHFQVQILCFHIKLRVRPVFGTLLLINFQESLKDWPIFLNFYRSSRPDVFWKKGVHRNFTKLTAKHLCQGLTFNKVFLKFKKETHRCFPVNFVKFLKKPFYTQHLWWLLLLLLYFV